MRGLTRCSFPSLRPGSSAPPEIGLRISWACASKIYVHRTSYLKRCQARVQDPPFLASSHHFSASCWCVPPLGKDARATFCIDLVRKRGCQNYMLLDNCLKKQWPSV